MEACMRFLILLSALVAVTSVLSAQRHNITINAETPEGQLLQQIGQEADAAQKTVLLEQFAAKYPKHEGILWVYEMMIPAYAKAAQAPKALEACDTLLTADPADAENAYECLKIAESTKDPATVIKWSARASEACRKVVQSAKPQEADEVEDWTKRVEYAKQADTYTEYALYAVALQTTAPEQKIALGGELARRNPDSKYYAPVAREQFLAYQQLGQKDKAAQVAESMVAKDPENQDMLLAAADYYMNVKNNDKALMYSTKLTEVLSAKPAPAGVAEADWTQKKNLVMGLGYWMQGVIYSAQNKFAPSDAALRKALPLIAANRQLLPGALFYLGLANYKMEKIPDALKFFNQCAATPSPFQAQAKKNILAIRREYVVR
jgi:tetratricopeptide (TPR) repeat protein